MVYRIFYLIIFILPFYSCRLKFATQDQGAQLAAMGFFPGGAPSWVGQSKSGAARIPESSGLIPQSFGAPRVVEREFLETGAEINDIEKKRFSRVTTENELQTHSTARQIKSINESNNHEDSPIARILQSCSSIERQVSDAIHTTDVRERIKKYESLTRRCPLSADLWVWLGKDYKSLNRLVEAHRCFEQALVADHDHEVAKALLVVVKKRLNSPVEALDNQN